MKSSRNRKKRRRRFKYECKNFIRVFIVLEMKLNLKLSSVIEFSRIEISYVGIDTNVIALKIILIKFCLIRLCNVTQVDRRSLVVQTFCSI